MKVVALQTDLQLILRIKNDDEQALKILFDKYFSALVQFSFRITHQKTIAEEVVADVFIELWKRRAYLDITHQVKAYLFMMVKNTSLNVGRNQKPHISLSDAPDEFSAFSLSPEEKFISDENLEDIGQLINVLSPSVRTVFLLNREEGFTYAEIAVILKLSVKTVESHMGKALKLMREAILKSNYKEYYHK